MSIVSLILAASLFSVSGRADYQQRFSLGVGVVTMNNPSQTNLEVGAEYEYRLDPLLGLGASGNYIFSNPSITLLAVPDFFVHPIATDWLISGAPLFEFGSGTGTHLGIRLGTRIPIPFGSFALVPAFAVDFINGGRDYLFGLGIEF